MNGCNRSSSASKNQDKNQPGVFTVARSVLEIGIENILAQGAAEVEEAEEAEATPDRSARQGADSVRQMFTENYIVAAQESPAELGCRSATLTRVLEHA
jgi:hypothetical protein